MAAVEQGLALRRSDPAQGVWITLHHLLVAARVAADAGRSAMARELLDQASTRTARFSDGMGAMHARLATIDQEPVRQAAAGSSESLTARERDVLRLLRSDLGLADIARELGLSTNTVKTHTQAVYRKLGVGSRAEAIVAARQHDLT